jgi:hypothetical protein
MDPHIWQFDVPRSAGYQDMNVGELLTEPAETGYFKRGMAGQG